MLYEVFNVHSLLQYPYYKEHSKETFDLLLETAFKIGREMLNPYFKERDRNPPRIVGDEVEVHPVVKRFMRECGEGGWISATARAEYGG